jgi:hypothetical protein
MTRDVGGELTACVVCGCTETDPCAPNSCSWALGAPALCSACAEFLLNIRSGRRLLAILRACNVRRDVFALLAAIGSHWQRRKRKARGRR